LKTGYNPHGCWVLVISLITPHEVKKKGLVLRPTLKGSLNLKVSKGPEETTCKNQMPWKNPENKYLRVFP